MTIYRTSPRALVCKFEDETEGMLCLPAIGRALRCNLVVTFDPGNCQIPLPDKASIQDREIVYRPLDLRSDGELLFR